jgi:hypothetical protein
VFSQRFAAATIALVGMPRVPFVSMVMLTLCILVLIMVGTLCVRHWVLAARGATYVGSLKGEQVASGGACSAPHCTSFCSTLHLLIMTSPFGSPSLACLLCSSSLCRASCSVQPVMQAPSHVMRIPNASDAHTSVPPPSVTTRLYAGIINNLRYVFGPSHPITWLAPSLWVPHVKKHI